MKILLLTQYYLPEIGAPQNRLSELAIRLKQMGDEIVVLTALPNYPHQKIYEGYRGKRKVKEIIEGIEVHRTWLFVRKSSSIFLRLLNYFSFVWSSFWYGWFKLGKFDLIICESPPLFLGITAWLLKKLKGSKLLFNVSDLWPESAEKLGLVTNRTFLKLAGSLERFMYKHSELISGQTQGIVKSISVRFPKKKIFWLRNGVNTNFFDPLKEYEDIRIRLGIGKDKFVIFYGGIIGHAQGLEVILKAASFIKETNVLFVLAGEGPVKEELMKMKETLNLSNVLFIPAFKKQEMPAVIKSIDASVIPLKKLDLFLGAIPSKIFESLNMKKPIILGVDGEARELFINTGNCGLYFEPENEKDLAEKIMLLFNDKQLYSNLAENAYDYVFKNFNRDIIAKEFKEFITN